MIKILQNDVISMENDQPTCSKIKILYHEPLLKVSCPSPGIHPPNEHAIGNRHNTGIVCESLASVFGGERQTQAIGLNNAAFH